MQQCGDSTGVVSISIMSRVSVVSFLVILHSQDSCSVFSRYSYRIHDHILLMMHVSCDASISYPTTVLFEEIGLSFFEAENGNEKKNSVSEFKKCRLWQKRKVCQLIQFICGLHMSHYFFAAITGDNYKCFLCNDSKAYSSNVLSFSMANECYTWVELFYRRVHVASLSKSLWFTTD